MGGSPDTPGVIAPPPLLFLGALGAGLAVDFVLLRVQTGSPAVLRYVLAAVFLASAVALIVAAITGFHRAGTRPEPWRPSTALVTGGVYGFTRNPMYMAMTLVYLAVAIAADSVIALVSLVPLLMVVHSGVILREERYLEARFGDEYRRYKHKVRRWI